MKQHFLLKTAAQESVALVVEKNAAGFRVTCGQEVFQFAADAWEKAKVVAQRRGQEFFLSTPHIQRSFEWKMVPEGGKVENSGHQNLAALFPGKVTKINVKAGDVANAKDVVLVMESMKMEYAYQAPEKIFIRKVLVCEGQVLAKGQAFFEYEGQGHG